MFLYDLNDKVITFPIGGSSITNSTITLPSNVTILNASLNLTGFPDENENYPTNPSVDIGGDGEIEWAFDGVGYGSMGYQNMFSTGKTSEKFIFNETNRDMNCKIKLPKDANITSSSFTLDGSFQDELLFTNIDDVRCVAVDNITNEVWYGTSGGLVRYKPQTGWRKVYTKYDGLPENKVNALISDMSGILVGTDSGIFLFNRTADQITPFFTEGEISSMHDHNNSVFYFNSYDVGSTVIEYNRNTKSFTTITKFQFRGQPATVPAMSSDEKTLYIGKCYGGLLRYNITSSQLESEWQELYDTRSILIHKGIVYISDDYGIHRYSSSNDSYIGSWGRYDFFNGHMVNSIKENQDLLYFGSEDGIFIFNTSSNLFEPNLNPNEVLQSNRVNSMVFGIKDAFIGTNKGIVLLHPSTQSYGWKSSSDNYISNSVSDIKVFENKIYFDNVSYDPINETYDQLIFSGLESQYGRPLIGAVDEKYFYINKDPWRLNIYEKINGNLVKSFYWGEYIDDIDLDENFLYVGMRTTINDSNPSVRVINRNTFLPVFELSKEEGIMPWGITKLISDQDHLYIGTLNGCFQYNKSSKTIETICERRVTSFGIDEDYLYIGQEYVGISRYNKKTGIIDNITTGDLDHYAPEKIISKGDIISILAERSIYFPHYSYTKNINILISLYAPFQHSVLFGQTLNGYDLLINCQVRWGSRNHRSPSIHDPIFRTHIPPYPLYSAGI